MENIIIPGVDRETPSINFDFSIGVLTIGEESLPHNPKDFYDPIIENIKEYLSTAPKKVVFEMKMIYFNTASSKKLMDIFDLFLGYKKGKVLVRWYYSDKEMKEEGEEFAFILDNKLPFEFIESTS